MIDILTHLHQYVPQVPYTTEKTLSTGETVHTNEAKCSGGDQMTAARTRAALSSRSNGETPSNRLEELIPVVEDWHTKANFLGVRFCVSVLNMHELHHDNNHYFIILLYIGHMKILLLTNIL